MTPPWPELVVDHDRLLEDVLHLLRDDARDDVVRPAGREGHDQVDRAVGKILRHAPMPGTATANASSKRSCRVSRLSSPNDFLRASFIERGQLLLRDRLDHGERRCKVKSHDGGRRRSISWCWKATASGRRSRPRRWPCCAPPSAPSACSSPSKPRRSAGRRTARKARRSRLSVLDKAKAARRRAARAGVAQRVSAGGRRRAQPVRRIAQAARPLRQYPPGALARGLSAALRQAGRSRHRAREHRRLLRRPQHVSRAPANSCRRPISRSPCARSRATARRASRRRRSSWRCSGAKK